MTQEAWAMTIGAGLMVHGLFGLQITALGAAGWSSDTEITMAIGAMLVVGG